MRPKRGFVLRLPVSGGDGDAVSRRLWQEQAVRTLPGSILSRPMPDGSKPGQGFVRFALVYPEDVTREALLRCRDILGDEPQTLALAVPARASVVDEYDISTPAA